MTAPRNDTCSWYDTCPLILSFCLQTSVAGLMLDNVLCTSSHPLSKMFTLFSALAI